MRFKLLFLLFGVIISSCASQNSKITTDSEIELKKTMINGKEFLPVVKVAPRYPVAAVRRGIQGSCTVEYTVTREGATKDHKALLCSHSIFEE